MLRRVLWAIGLMLTVGIGLSPAVNFRPCTWRTFEHYNKNLCGRLLNFTRNHRGDNRIWSAALCDRRDLYVYLPPGFNPSKCYPGMIYMHGIAEDEVAFLRLIEVVDRAMACGDLPPMIIAAPDGTTLGVPSILNAGSFYVNSRAGRFEDYIIQDVWGFLTSNFPIRPEPECHVLAGASMGGFGAYNLGIKYRNQFKLVAGIFPPLNTRYEDCTGHYFSNYDPSCLGCRERLKPFRAVGRFYGVVTVHEHTLSHPLYGSFNKQAIQNIARENPYEMLDTFDLKPGELEMFVCYGKRDEFNIDAQIESFLDKARCRGIDIACVCDPEGRHNTDTGVRLFPHLCAWLRGKLPPCP